MMNMSGRAKDRDLQIRVCCSANFVSENPFPEDDNERLEWLERKLADCKHSIQCVRSNIETDKVFMMVPEQWTAVVYAHDGELFLMVECGLMHQNIQAVTIPFSKFPEQFTSFEALKQIVIDEMQRNFGDRLVPCPE